MDGSASRSAKQSSDCQIQGLRIIQGLDYHIAKGTAHIWESSGDYIEVAKSHYNCLLSLRIGQLS